jgi:hypothetical protein
MLFTGYFSGTHYATVGTHFDNDFAWQRTWLFIISRENFKEMFMLYPVNSMHFGVTPVPCGSTEFVILVSKNVEKSLNFLLKKKVIRCILNCYILGVSKFNRLIPVNICFNCRNSF